MVETVVIRRVSFGVVCGGNGCHFVSVYGVESAHRMGGDKNNQVANGTLLNLSIMGLALPHRNAPSTAIQQWNKSWDAQSDTRRQSKKELLKQLCMGRFYFGYVCKSPLWPHSGAARLCHHHSCHRHCHPYCHHHNYHGHYLYSHHSNITVAPTPNCLHALKRRAHSQSPQSKGNYGMMGQPLTQYILVYMKE